MNLALVISQHNLEFYTKLNYHSSPRKYGTKDSHDFHFQAVDAMSVPVTRCMPTITRVRTRGSVTVSLGWAVRTVTPVGTASTTSQVGATYLIWSLIYIYSCKHA